MNWDDYRIEFPITNRFAYLNNAAYAPMPLRAVEAMRDFLMECSEKGPDSLGFHEKVKAKTMKVRREISEVLSCRAKEVIFTESATQSINYVASMLKFRKGDEVILRDGTHEHPSNFLPWLHLERTKGIRLRRLRIDKNGFFNIGELETVINERTRLLVLTHVLYNTGAIMPVEEAGRIAREKDVLFFVDASQSVGCVPVDVKKVKCDFLAFTGAKWLCGPLGTGGFYCRAEVGEKLDPGMIDSEAMESYTSESYKFAAMPDRFQGGFRNWAGVVGLSSSLTIIQHLGIAKVRERNMALADEMRDKLVKLKDFKVYGPDEPERRNSIVAFNVKGVKAESVVKRLVSKGIVVAKRELMKRDVVRASPHFYNSFEEANRAVEALKNIP